MGASSQELLVADLQRCLAAEVAKHIREFPETYDQSTWGSIDIIDPLHPDGDARSCGTAACVAGWAVRLASPLHLGLVLDEIPHHRYCDDTVHVSFAAQHLLGLDSDEADSLFECSNPKHNVLETLDAMTHRPNL